MEGKIKRNDVFASPAFDEGLQLSHGVLHLISQQQFLLVQLFQRIYAPLSLCEIDNREGSASDLIFDIELA